MSEGNTLDTTVDEWQAEIQKLESKGDPGFSIEELAQKLNCAAATARKRANALVKKGACIRGKGIRRGEDGRIRRLPVYQLIITKAGEK